MEYKDYNDNELLMYISEKSDDAIEIMQKKYDPIIKQYANYLMNVPHLVGLEFNDLYQEGLMGLSIAIETYDENAQNSFFTFATTCIKRTMLNLFNKTIGNKNEFLNRAYSLDNDNSEYIEYHFTSNQITPEENVMDKYDTKILRKRIYNKLTGIEKKVFELRLQGFTYKEISRLIHKSYKSIDNAIQRIRAKSKIILDEYYG